MKKLLLVAVATAGLFSTMHAQNVYSQGFDAAFPATWTTTNQSAPSTTALWSKATYTLAANTPFGGTATVLPQGQSGGSNSFALVNYSSTSGAGTISNWLITEDVLVKDGDVVSFYTRKGTSGSTDYPDRLELRYSTGATTIPSGGAADVGSFTNVGVTVNPSLVAGFVYPKVWTKYQFTVSGVGTTPVAMRFGFRYYVTDGGPDGNNSDIIGIDTFSVDRVNLGTSEVVSKSKISIYPNPATEEINIKGAEKIKSVRIFDSVGRLVSESKTSATKVNVANLQKGNYILEVEGDASKSTHTFIKK